MIPPLDIVGIGVSVWDSVMLVDVLPERGSVVRAKRHVEGIGGGITVAIATAARLGSKTAMIDSLGDDPPAMRILDVLAREGVDTRCVVRQTGQSSSVASIWSETQAAERTIIFSPGTACDRLRWTPEIEELISQSKVLHLNGRHPEVCRRAIAVAKASGTKVSFDGGAYRYRDEIVPLLAAADVAIVARQFAHSHFKRQVDSAATVGPMELAEFLRRDLDCELAGVTDGADGSYLVGREGVRFHQEAISPERAVDTTGCGDTYHGAFLHGYVSGLAIRQAARFAAEVASQNARRLGGLAFDHSACGSAHDGSESPSSSGATNP
ncbi:5-dehydro-2-deoxygluconokinase [Stieleria maiorica]|uniref:5-dehydro-2-deoxygluconokinase n=1 Tax=Stieleria maiorica TaxID=2795974 RepID=A0A5B9MEN7_9BACT|nr:carbohydrate kinase family protein [Stieleria maiorica]QEF98979.1 5-dehydro-2-deoxygluconokinase [Stieleria maiorica]